MGTIAPGGASAMTLLRTSTLLLVVAAVVFAVNTYYASFLAGREDNARAAAAELQVLSQQLAKFGGSAVAGDADAFDAFAVVRQRIDTLVNGLRRGDAGLGLMAYEGNMLELGAVVALRKVTDLWSKMSADADRIGKSREHVLSLNETAASFNIRVPQISAQLAEVVRGMSDGGSASSQINLANRQIVLADRMSRRVTEILAGGDAAVTAADALQRDGVVFGQVLQALRFGTPEDGVTRVTHPAATVALERVAQLFAQSQKELDVLLVGSTEMAEVQQSAASIAADSDVLLEASRELHGKIGSNFARVFPNDLLGLAAALVAAFALVGVVAAAHRMQLDALRRP